MCIGRVIIMHRAEYLWRSGTVQVLSHTGIEPPPWNTSPPTVNREVEDSPIQSVCQSLQEELERCSTQDVVGETI